MIQFDIPQLFSIGKERLDAGGERPKKLLGLYLLVFAATSIGVTVLDYILTLSTEGLSGLSNVATRSVLGTFQTLLGILSAVLLPMWYYCFASGSLQTYRGKNPEPKSMVTGFHQWKRLLMAGFMFLVPIFVTSYLVIMLVSYFLTTVILSQMDPATIQAFVETQDISLITDTVLPIALVCAAIVIVITVFFLFRYRLAFFLLSDFPKIPGSQVLRCSSRMMRRNMKQFLRLDLRFWWYYAAQVLIGLIPSVGVIANLSGTSLPIDSNLMFLISGILHTVLLCALDYSVKNRMIYTYAAAYDRLLQVKSEQLFQMQQSYNAPKM